MRMWKVNPKFLCTRHLLGEHVEMHMFVGTITRGKSIQGFIDGGLVEVHSISKRHDQLVREMIGRGFNHRSPLPEFAPYPAGQVNVQQSLDELKKRCPDCQQRMVRPPAPQRSDT